ncbi:MAG TPA: hypothetical protein VNJ04_04050 [Gemmatimonadaceae bacterium]|nr:hypothetical protein [Gemmatimonadaceae bacterium]
MTPDTEVEQLRRQNALLLKRLLFISRERDHLRTLMAALRSDVAVLTDARVQP